MSVDGKKNLCCSVWLPVLPLVCVLIIDSGREAQSEFSLPFYWHIKKLPCKNSPANELQWIESIRSWSVLMGGPDTIFHRGAQRKLTWANSEMDSGFSIFEVDKHVSKPDLQYHLLMALLVTTERWVIGEKHPWVTQHIIHDHKTGTQQRFISIVWLCSGNRCNSLPIWLISNYITMTVI